MVVFSKYDSVGTCQAAHTGWKQKMYHILNANKSKSSRRIRMWIIPYRRESQGNLSPIQYIFVRDIQWPPEIDLKNASFSRQARVCSIFHHHGWLQTHFYGNASCTTCNGLFSFSHFLRTMPTRDWPEVPSQKAMWRSDWLTAGA